MKRSIIFFILCLLFTSITVSAVDNPIKSGGPQVPPSPQIISNISINHIK